jgi:hypothetical protein
MILFFVSNLRDRTLSCPLFENLSDDPRRLFRSSIPGLDAFTLLLRTGLVYVRTCTSKCTLCLVYIYRGCTMREIGRFLSQELTNGRALDHGSSCTLLGMALSLRRTVFQCSRVF